MSNEHRHSNGSVCLGPEEPEPEEGRMMSVVCFVLVAAFICAVAEALGKCPGWVVSILLCIAGLLSCLPIK
jgi:hypothetical protein